MKSFSFFNWPILMLLFSPVTYTPLVIFSFCAVSALKNLPAVFMLLNLCLSRTDTRISPLFTLFCAYFNSLFFWISVLMGCV